MKKQMSVYGSGPLYVSIIVGITLIVLYLEHTGVINRFVISGLETELKIIGRIIMLASGLMWIKSAFKSKLQESVKENKLVTTGVYAYVRNPIYTAITFFIGGILIFNGNMYLLLLMPVYWAIMTVLMKYTEEKWLRELYGQEYEDYCEKVNRCIPWFKRK